MQRAPEPSDIFWENIGVSGRTVMRRRVGTWLATALMLAGGVVVVTLSSTVRKELLGSQDGTELSVQVQIISFLPSCLVVLVNMLLSYIIRTFSKFEKHPPFRYGCP